ncbi:MAG: hypothetical protein KJ593_01165 [Candidatus Omnitrophica bacterium]|nr:hypothetical protein [Candidatus Omnitrophota bacterium]
MRPLKKQKYKFDIKRISAENKDVKKDKDLTPRELFDEIVRTKSRRRHR